MTIHIRSLGSQGDSRTLKTVLATAQPGTTIELDTGWYAFDAPVRIAPGVRLVGAGDDRTTLVNTGGNFSAFACCFQPVGGVVTLEGLTLESACGEREQAQTLGWQGSGAPSGATLIVRDCVVIGRAFALYTWGPPNNRIVCERTTIQAGRWCVTAGAAPGTWPGLDSQDISLYDCTLIADFAQHKGAGGDVNAGQSSSAGIVARGGRVRMFGGSINVKGCPEIDLAVGAWCTPQPGTWTTDGTWPLVELTGTKIAIEQNGSKRAVDTEALIGKVVVK